MDDRETKGQLATLERPSTDSNKPRSSFRPWIVVAVLVVAVGAILLTGIRSRLKAESALRSSGAAMAIPSVSVVQPKPTAPVQEIVLPGNIQPLISSPIYARTDGYLKKWYFDIGAHVKKGDLLAVIETPEVDQQLSQARSNLATAQANLELSKITKDRYEALLKKHAVSQQDADNAAAGYRANLAVVDADKANVQRFETLVSFEKVYAPFDGVITARNTDIGDLINAGSSTSPRTDLFHISQTGVLRVYVNVPQEYSQRIKPGDTQADIVLPEFPGQKFPGTLVRTSQAINMTTRTLLVEVDVENPDQKLLTGSYAEVHLKIAGPGSTYLIPSNCLIFRSQGLQVALVKDDKVTLANVALGHDLGAEVEVVSGLHASDQVIVNPSDSIITGQQVNAVKASLPGDVK